MALFVVSMINFVAYNIFCLTYGDAANLRDCQTIFVSFSTFYLGILTIAFAVSLRELSQAIKSTQGIEVSRIMLTINLVAMTFLFALEFVTAVCWASDVDIMTITMVNFYLEYPIKYLIILIAWRFGQKQTVMCNVAADGSLVVRGIGLNGEILFELEFGRYMSFDELAASSTDQSELLTESAQMKWMQLEDNLAESMLIATSFMR